MVNVTVNPPVAAATVQGTVVVVKATILGEVQETVDGWTFQIEVLKNTYILSKKEKLLYLI